jgi:O-antigen biosynthesis protein
VEQPLVSIVITVFNYGRFLATAIESALRQRYEPLEVLVLDNASTDETPDVVARYVGDPRVRAIRHPANIGLTPNHNAGLALARGAYVGFLSADDALAPDFIAHAMRFYREHPDVDVLYGGAYSMTESERLVRVREWPGQQRAGYTGARNELAVLLAEGAFMCMPTMLVPRWVWDRFGPFDAGLVSADWDLTARWAAGGVRFGFDPEPVAFVRSHGEQNSGLAKHNATGREMRDYVTIFERFLDPAQPERYAGHEVAIKRMIQNRAEYFRTTFGDDSAAEFDAATSRLHARIDAIADANRGRPRERTAIIVVADESIGALQGTLEALLALDDDTWSAIVVQETGISYEPLCHALDRTRIRYAHLPDRRGLGAAIACGASLVEADLYLAVRAGTRILPGHLASVRDAFADPATAVACCRPALQIEREAVALPFADDVAVTIVPPAVLEGLAFSRAAFSTFGFREIALPDWDFLIRASLHGTVRAFSGAVEVSERPGMRYARLAAPAALNAVITAYHTYPVIDVARLSARAAFIERLRAAQRHDRTSAAGLRAFYEELTAPG